MLLVGSKFHWHEAVTTNLETVLQLKNYRNDFYGGKWASFNLHSIYDWSKRLRTTGTVSDVVIDKRLLKENEELLVVNEVEDVSDVRLEWHIE